ncbi:hypothetical protein QN277_002214 [Acacia crassicarpa]|uniref:Uncharacterized protein n=1 Tax=Acacia crassicarpa TaxID=499986 RepID=A0AAE1N8U3_9FABA|nr:hypothetical protein QN277_002214 [Acacia crassicarpa]
MELEGAFLFRNVVHRSDAAFIMSGIKRDEKQIQLKRRWLLGVAASKSDRKRFKKSKFLEDRFLPESLLREDDVFYESVRTYVGGVFGEHDIEREFNVIQDEMLSVDMSIIKRMILCLDKMTTRGLYLLAMIIAGGSVRFEKTRCKLKKIVKSFLSSALSNQNSNGYQLEIFKQLFGVLNNQKHFQHNCKPLSASRCQSNHSAIEKVMNDLNDFPYQTLSAMRRKLKGVKATMPQLRTCRKGWRQRKHVSKTVRSISMKMVSQLGEGDELQEPLAKAMAVANLSLKLATHCNDIFSEEFYQFPPEVNSLQNDIMKAIWLVKNEVGIEKLRNLKTLLEPKAKVSNKILRSSFTELLTEFLFECDDMERIPRSLFKILDFFNGSSDDRPFQLGQGKEKIEEEVDYILSISAQTKQIVLDLLPDHRFDEDFTDAYVEQLEESEDDYDDPPEGEDRHFMNGICDSMGSDYKAESVGQFVPFGFNPTSFMSDEKTSTVPPESVLGENFVKRHNLFEGNAGMDPGNVATNFSREAVEPEYTRNDMRKNQYLIIQDACDETSTLTHKLIGHLLWEFAKFEGLDLNDGQSLYLRGDNEIKDVQVGGQSSSSEKDVRNSAIVRIVEELVPSFSDSAMERLKKLIGS